MKAPLILLILAVFIINSIGPLPLQAEQIILPKPGAMVHLSPEYRPVTLRGVTVDPNNPFKFDFIIDKGDSNVQLKEESVKLVKYFLTSMTTPEQDLWVNLSPYEKSKIIPNSFGQTDMGRDLLAQDYLLKQITASLIYPEDEIGKKFWKRVYEESARKFGNTNMPVNTFNKVWIVPDKAKVYEHGNTAFIVNSRLKVMLEEDYLASEKNLLIQKGEGNISNQIIREIVIPQLEKEVNNGKNFAPLRQVYQSLILAMWFKKRMKDSVLGYKYMDQNKDFSVSSQYDKFRSGLIVDPDDIYQQYLEAFKKGVYSYIKEEIDPVTQQSIPRRYFSGGVVGVFRVTEDFAMVNKISITEIPDSAQMSMVEVSLANESQTENPNPAMSSEQKSNSHRPNVAVPSLNEVKLAIGVGEVFQQGMATAILQAVNSLVVDSGHNIEFIDVFNQILSARIRVAEKLGDILILDTLNITDRLNGESGYNITTVHSTGSEYSKLYQLLNERIRPKMTMNPNESGGMFLNRVKGLVSDGDYLQLIILSNNGYFSIHHAGGTQIPAFMKRLGELWDVIRDGAAKQEDRVDALAKFEWLFFQSNPVGRAGASMGDALSFIGQILLGIQLRNEFINQDFEALTMTFEEYVKQRKDYFLRAVSDNAQLSKVPVNQEVGGIDLTAGRMNFDVDKDQVHISQPMNLKAFENIQIDSLYIKSIQIKPITNLRALLGVE